jgi:hypothetical protein
MQEQALEIASHITHPVTVAAFALVFAATAFHLALRAKRPRIAWILVVAIMLLGIAPLVASTYVQSRGVYRIRVVVLGPDGSPTDDARVDSSNGGEPKKVASGWEFDIPLQTRPADGVVIFFATVPSAFLRGHTRIVLAQDYYPTITIQLTSDTSAILRGSVIDEHGKPVPKAIVSIVGYTESTLTNDMGNFALSAHAADGQMVQVRAQKDQLVGSVSAPAGRVAVEITIKRR